MAEEVAGELSKAWTFFERARKVAETNNFDYAIEMYIEGLQCAPDEVQDGHIKLYELAIQRQSKGGKKPSMMEKVKQLRGGKTPLEQMLNAEYLFAKDPAHMPYAEAMLKAAVTGGYKKTAGWIADLVFQINNTSSKPSAHTYILLKDSYSAIGNYDRALLACQFAVKQKPGDGALADEFKRLSAELTVSRGRYDQGGDFRQSIKNREGQEKQQAQEGVVKSDDYRLSVVEDARKAFTQDPNLPKNIFNLSEVLANFQEDKYENEAIEILEKAYNAKKDFSFKQRAGVIKIRQLNRKVREAKAALEANPHDALAKAKYAEFVVKLRSTELEHYRLCVENYPTDLQAKYEYGVRLMQNKQCDEAIPLFQEAQRDPRHRIIAMGKIGLCFFMKGWFADAADVFNQAIDAYEVKDDSVAKELRYNLARALEEQGDTNQALEIYRKIAQLDFGYKDVRKRVDELRSRKSGPASQ